jgi:hypothetical protein
VKKAKLSVLLGSIFIILVFSLGPVYSTPLSSASYSIPSLTISSGGHTGLQSSSYKLQDIKGQAVIGYGSSASYGLGIGGVYGTLVTIPPETIRVEGAGYGLGPDDGLIQNTRIRIEGSDIVLSWTRTGGIASVDIWRSADEDYNPGGTWTQMNTPTTPIAALEQRYSGIVRNVPHKAYYRVVPSGTALLSIHLRSNNAITVGKFDLVNLPAATNLISTPLVCFTGSTISNVFSGQLDGLTFYDFDDANQTYLETTTLSHGKSYWVTLPTIKTVTIVGGVPNIAFNSTIYGTSKYNLIASPTAKAIAPFITGANLPALGTANQVYLFSNTDQTYFGLRETTFGFNPGVGYWYYLTGSDYPWTLTRP